MKKTMQAAVMTEFGKIEFQEKNVPEAKANEVLVQVDYVGICGSDLHYFEHGRIGNFIVELPFILGHEVAGTVVAVGSDVDHLVPGDRVAMEPQITCGECDQCKSGKYNLCRDVKFFATPPIDGVFQEYVTHPANLCFKLPDSVSTLEGAMIEPLSVGLHAAFQGGAQLGQNAVVTGCGCVGLTSMLAMKASGVSRVFMTDLFDKRLAKAQEMGADAVLNGKEESVVDRVMELTDGKGFDLAIESSGSEIAAAELINCARPGATIVFVGYSPSGMMNLPIGLALDKEITFKTIFRYRNSYPKAIQALANKQIDVKPIVSHFFDFKDTQECLDSAIRDKDQITKAVIKVSGE